MKQVIFIKPIQNSCCILMLGLLMICALSVDLQAACYPDTLSVDFGITGQTTGCWDSWDMLVSDVLDASDPNRLIAISSTLGQASTVGVKVEWTGGSGVGVRNRTLDGSHLQYNLLMDNIYNDGGSMAVRIYDLQPGTYEMTTYHADPGNKRNPIDITIDDGRPGCDTGVSVIPDVQQSLGITAADGVSSITFAFMVSGNESNGILIEFDDAGGSDIAGPVLNGFEIVRPAQDIIKVDVGRAINPFSGYDQMNAVDDGEAHPSSVTVSSIYGVSGTVDLALSDATYLWRTPGMTVGDPLRLLLGDLCYSSAITLTIDGFKAGVYQVSSYLNDPGVAHKKVDIFVDGVQVADEASQSGTSDTSLACYSKILVPFTVENDNDTVVIDYETGLGGSGSAYVVLAGFEIGSWQLPEQLVCGDSSLTPLLGDYNGDCHVDVEDVKALAGQWLDSTLP